MAILIDCTEQFCRETLARRYAKDKEEGAERADDEESVVKTRLGLFKQNTLPMLKYLDDKGKLKVVRVDTHGDNKVGAKKAKAEFWWGRKSPGAKLQQPLPSEGRLVVCVF